MAQSVEEAYLDEGLCTIEAEFFTEHLVVRGEVTSPEVRLSDHLNSSTSTFEVDPSRIHRTLGGSRADFKGSSAYINKSHLLFVLPIDETVAVRPAHDSWSQTITQRCWAALGRYALVGKVHMEATRNPRFFLRSLERRQFLPFTDVRLTFPDGTTRDYPAVIVNRFQMELLALESDAG